MGIRQKFTLGILVGIVAFWALFFLSLTEQRQAVLDAYIARNRSVVSVVISLLGQFEQRRQEGGLTLAQAQEMARNSIRQLRYDGSEYLFVANGDGRLLVQPANPAMEGSGPELIKDGDGRVLWPLVREAVDHGDGVMRYTYTRIDGGQPRDKISYFAEFPAWGWLVGTGVYVEDAEAAFLKTAWRFALATVPIALLLVMRVFLWARSVTGPIGELVLAINAIRAKCFDRAVPYTSRSDEVGELARTVESLQKVSMLEDQVRQARELVASVFDASQEAVMICDPQGTIVQVSPALCRISGYACADLVGQNASILASGHHSEKFFHDMWLELDAGRTWEGEVWNRRANGEVFVVGTRISPIRDAQGRVVNHVATMHDVVEYARRQKPQRYLQLHDPLTSLADRVLLAEKLSSALALTSGAGRSVALLEIDLDRFADLNARYGMVVGDEVLRFAALRLMQCVHSADTVARLEGDTFVVLMEGVMVPEVADTQAHAILTALREPLQVCGHQVAITASIGIALAPRDGRIEGRLLEICGEAMRQAKAEGGDCVVHACDLARSASVQV